MNNTSHCPSTKQGQETVGFQSTVSVLFVGPDKLSADITKEKRKDKGKLS